MKQFMNDSLGITRRYFFEECGVGLGKMALGVLLGGIGRRAARLPRGARRRIRWRLRQPHFAPRAKRVIHLFMAGAPSQLDLFDYKPDLARLEGQPLPPSVIGGQRYAFIRPDAAVLGPQFKFARHGQCGASLSEMLPHLATVVDDICIVKSTRTDQFNHAPAQIFLNTGFSQPGRPSLGIVGALRSGLRVAGLAGVCGDVDRQRHQRRGGELVERVLADRVYGRAAAKPGRPDPEYLEPAGRGYRGSSEIRSTWWGRSIGGSFRR